MRSAARARIGLHHEMPAWQRREAEPRIHHSSCAGDEFGFVNGQCSWIQEKAGPIRFSKLKNGAATDQPLGAKRRAATPPSSSSQVDGNGTGAGGGSGSTLMRTPKPNVSARIQPLPLRLGLEA